MAAGTKSVSLLQQNADAKQSNGLQRASRSLKGTQCGYGLCQSRESYNPKQGGRHHSTVYGLASQMPTSTTSHRLQAIVNVSENKTIFLSKVSYGERVKRVISKGQKGPQDGQLFPKTSLLLIKRSSPLIKKA